MNPLQLVLRDVAGPGGDWRDLALCAETDPELFFPGPGESYRDARRICARCDVSVECLNEALRLQEDSGVWGGTSPSQRWRMQARKPATTVCARGHERTEENTLLDGRCRVCKRLRQKAA